MSKVAIVGVEGSGKTVLMAALADQYGKPSKDSLYLMPENQAAFSFMTHIPHKMREEHQWPAATAMESMKHLKWTLRVGQEVLMELELLDYPGELYRLAFGDRKEAEIEDSREQVHEFLEHLVTADYLVVLLNLKDAMDIGANPRNSETVWLTRGIFDYSSQLPGIRERLLLFTQADRYSEELDGPGGLTAAKEKFMPMLHALYPDLECAAVSVATDDKETPNQEFSASLGIKEFMSWLSSKLPSKQQKKECREKMIEFIEAYKRCDGEQPLINLKNELDAYINTQSGGTAAMGTAYAIPYEKSADGQDPYQTPVELREVVSTIITHIEQHFLWQRVQWRCWAPVSNKYPDKITRHVIDNMIESSRSFLIVVLVLCAIMGVVIIGINE